MCVAIDFAIAVRLMVEIDACTRHHEKDLGIKPKMLAYR